MGLFKVARQWYWPWSFKEKEIAPRNVVSESHYDLPMGKHVILKLLYYRPDVVEQLGTVDLTIEALGDGFAGGN